MSALYGIVAQENRQIRQVRVPVPYPLQYVNAYLIQGDRGWTVLDPGIHSPEALELWDEVFRSLGIGFRQLERIVLTHHHPDHYGLAGYFQHKSGAPVFLSEWGRRQADDLWGNGDEAARRLWRLFRLHGMDEALADAMLPHMAGFTELVSPRPETAPVRDGDMLELGDSMWEAVETGGHAAGHMSFYRKDTGEMFCGDAVLPRISPNINYMPGVEEEPLAGYLEGLRRLSAYAVERAYPGHRDSFREFAKRCGELAVHHEKRLGQMADQIGAGPSTAYECCAALFGTRLTVHQFRFAMCETLAHLIHLEGQGRLHREERDGRVVFFGAEDAMY